MLQRAVADFDRDVDWQYSLFEAAGDALVGGCGLHRTASDDCAEITYWVRSDRHGRGYATAAARCLTSAAFGALPQLNTVQIRMDCANVASARVPEKLGYRLVGTESHEVLAHGHTGVGTCGPLPAESGRLPSQRSGSEARSRSGYRSLTCRSTAGDRLTDERVISLGLRLGWILSASAIRGPGSKQPE